MIEDLKKELDHLKEFRSSRFDNVKDTELRTIIMKALSKASAYIDDEVYKLESRERNKKNAETMIIDGQEVNIPRSMNFGSHGDWVLKDNVISFIDNKNIWDEDGSFHFYAISWFKDDNKYVRLTIRFLGNDRFGDRIYTEAFYYKDENDAYSYLNKHVKPNGKYKNYVNDLIYHVRTYEGLENFMKG